jgi:ASCH domain-containing protein
MKCLSLRQPYASLIVSGIKTIETRTWKTNYRGKILIHAALKPIELPKQFQARVKEINPEVLSATGKIIGSVDVIDCRPLLAKDKKAALVDEIENKYAWLLENPEVFKEFIPLKGKLGLFNVV